ncbi:Uma2 family endonuclease [Trichocoleus sp. ST-U3]
MVQYNPLQHLPTAEELPETDHKPVESQLQILVANLLEEILAWLWQNRTDWFWGINMGVYYDPEKSAIVPDGFLSLGVERLTRTGGRLSYVIWQEGKVPLLALEYVSKTYGQEYDNKKDEYASIGVSYYAIYNPEYHRRDKHNPFEVYRLVDGQYVLQSDEPVWIPEIGLGIGRAQGTYRAWTREWLYWYDQNGNQLSTPAEVAQQERQWAERLAERLRQMGVDPDTL